MCDFLESPQAISLADFLDKLQEIQGVLMDEYSVDDFSKLMAVREPFMEFMKKTAGRKFLQSFYIVEEGATNKRFIADVDRTDDAAAHRSTGSGASNPDESERWLEKMRIHVLNTADELVRGRDSNNNDNSNIR